MSNNLGQFAASKNPAWGRTNASPNMVPQNQQGLNMPQIMNQGLNNMNNAGMLQFQQQHPQVFQNALGIQQQNLGLGLQQMANNALGASQLASNQIFQQVNAVSYPNPRALNTAAFQTTPNISPLSQLQSGGNSNSGTKQRVFTGTVTKVHDNFGFVDEDVFFQTNACEKGSNPVVGDIVLVEASYNPSMPFKWNATRIQVLPTSGHNQQQSVRHSSGSSKKYSTVSGYNCAVPPPESNGSFSNNRSNNRPKASTGGRGRERSRDREREEDDMERKKRREERQREREKEEKKSPVRRRSRSPKARRRPRIVPRYMVQIPKLALNSVNADVLELRRRYSNMYVPSDFFHSSFEWVKAFPPNKPFSLSKTCFFHIMNKEVQPVVENNAVLEPADADYLFSAKVMLMNVPGMDELYHKCCGMAEDEDKRDRDGEEKDYIHPSRLINFLIGLRGKNETMAIGGPWSPSLDGVNPGSDPSVLIKTAIRTCKALTGIDLSNCSQWYRFMELYYRRTESVHKGKNIPARVETVVIYLPDVWSCVPTRLEWDNLLHSYQKQLERELKADLEPADETQPSDEKEEDQPMEKLDPTHHSLLDVKSMTVKDLKRELQARNVNPKGLKSQLVARLGKLLKAEADKGNEDAKDTSVELDEPEMTQEEKKTEVEDKKLDEKEKALLQKRYTLPDQQHIIVHPSKTAKSGKFDCTIMSLSLLLDYRPEDTKEHSFEVSLFAELFNEMLMRDFGFNIYKALHELPEKPKEKEEPKKREKDERKPDDKKKHDDKKRDDDRKKDSDKKKDEDKKKDDEKEKKEDRKSDDGREKDEKKLDSKKNDRRSDDSDEDDDGNDDDKDRKKDKDKKKSRVKLYTKDKHLLLSFVYFDQTHCGYIFDKDIEDLLYTLGLSLSRAQVRKLVGKVITRDSLHYRKLTDKPKDEEIALKDEITEQNLLKELATGNGKLLPVFVNEGYKEPSVIKKDIISNNGMVMFQGALVDVGKLMSQLERSDKARLEAESRILNLKNENTKLNDKYDKTNQSIKRVSSELKEYKEKLRTAEDTLSKTMVYSKLFQTTLTEIRDKIDPVLKSTSIIKEESTKKEKDADRDKKEKSEAKSRWEKDVKIETMDVDDNVEEKK